MSKTFEDFGFRPEIGRALDEAGFDVPTPIQQQAIPTLLGGGDLIGVAETGTGKTLAFMLPILEPMNSRYSHPRNWFSPPKPKVGSVFPLNRTPFNLSASVERRVTCV